MLEKLKNCFLLCVCFVVLIFTSCSNNDYRYFGFQSKSADSIITFYKSHKGSLPPFFLGEVRNRLYLQNKKDESDKVFNFLNSEIKSGNLNVLEEAYFNYGESFFWLYQDRNKSKEYLNKIPKELVNTSDTFILKYNNLLGQYYFQEEKLDSSLMAMHKAFSAAIELGDTVEMGRMATNLGGINSILGFDEAAMEYLLRARGYDKNNLILSNNLASVLISQKQYLKAKELLEEIETILEPNNSNPEFIILNLTRIHLYQEMGLWDESNKLLVDIDIKDIPPIQHYNYYCFYLLQQEYNNATDIDSFLNVLKREKGNYVYSELFYNLSTWYGKFKMKNINNHFINHIEDLDTNVFDKVSMAAYFNLKANYYKLKGNMVASAEMRTESARFLKQHYIQKLQNKETDLKNRLELFELEKKYAKSKQETERVAWKLKVNNGILFFGFLFSIFVTIVYLREKKLRIQNKNLTDELVIQKQLELDILERENQTSKKLVDLSNRIIEASKEIKNKLSKVTESNLTGVKESIKDLDYILFLNKSVDTTVVVRGYDFDKLDFLKDLIESQRQVLSLSLDNYKPKEIGVTLNLSYSYVRNIQTQLRKTLKDAGYDTFDALKKDLEA